MINAHIGQRITLQMTLEYEGVWYHGMTLTNLGRMEVLYILKCPWQEHLTTGKMRSIVHIELAFVILIVERVR